MDRKRTTVFLVVFVAILLIYLAGLKYASTTLPKSTPASTEANVTDDW